MTRNTKSFFSSRLFSSTAFISVISIVSLSCCKSYAAGDTLPQPVPTAATVSPSVEEIGQSQTTITPSAVVVKPAVVELKSEYINKNQAIQRANTDHYKLVVSYSVSGGVTLQPDTLPTHYFYYLNRKTHQIGVAINKAAAQQLTIDSHAVYCAKQGDTLKATLTRWAAQGHYTLEWLSEYDYGLKYSYEFVGSLEDKAGPLNQILSSIAGTSYALKAVITENNVILIKDNDFSPSVLSK